MVFGYAFADDKEVSVADIMSTMSIEDKLGQLFMVGIPTEITGRFEKETKTLIKNLKPGGIFLNSYNTKRFHGDKRTLLDEATELKRYINKINQYYYKDKLVRVPFDVALDFEGPKFTSISSGINGYLPPSSMVLSGAGNLKIARDVGLSVGLLLQEIGVSILFGPSLDVENTVQGDVYSVTGNRVYSDNVNRVVDVAGSFLEGLNKTKVKAYVKHFPGHGSVSGNPHSLSDVIFLGQKHEFEKGLIPYRRLSDKYQGVVTSHVWFDLESKPVTFHNSMVGKLLRTGDSINLGLGKVEGLKFEKIIITDDMSDMDVLKKYSNSLANKNSTMANLALTAGHDVLLYSHVSVSDFKTKGVRKAEKRMLANRSSMGINLKELIKIRDSLKDYFLTKGREKKLDDIVARILRGKLDRVRGGTQTRSKVIFDMQSVDADYFSKKSTARADIESLFREVYEKSVFKLNNRIKIKQIDFMSNQKVLAFVPDFAGKDYIRGIKNVFSNVDIVVNKNDKSILCNPVKDTLETCNKFRRHSKNCLGKKNKCIKRFDLYFDFLKRSVDKYDYIIFPVHDSDDSKLLDAFYLESNDANKIASMMFSEKSISKNQGKLLRNKLIIFVFNTPRIINVKLLSNADIYVMYDKSKYALDLSLKILSEGIKTDRMYPNENMYVHGVPISLGSNGMVYDQHNDLHIFF